MSDPQDTQEISLGHGIRYVKEPFPMILIPDDVDISSVIWALAEIAEESRK